ncbi:MAG: peptidase T [Gemmataceae bacterium]
MQINSQRLTERFCRYVKVDTQADETATTYPSSPGQIELGKLLVGELKEMGIDDVEIDENGIVMATVPPTGNESAPVIAYIAHVDTSPETSGRDVKPTVHENYDGEDIVLPADPTKVIRVSENPELTDLKGKTIITTDGTTLLGADDKAGVAVIMEAAETLLANPDIAHGPLRICFTCDEEIGKGVDHVDLQKLGAAVGYTLDGGGQDTIAAETFSADLAVVTIHGVNIHPSIGKGAMVNAIRIAGAFLDRLPWQTLSPETTENRQGFLHPYKIDGGVDKVTIRILLRDFDTPKLAEYAQLLEDAANVLRAEHPRAQIDIAVTKQYRNMGEWISKDPRSVEFAKKAIQRIGLEPKEEVIRGGTDGSRLTEMGLPTPNLPTGEHNPHSPLEWTCLEEMENATRILIELAQVWNDE